MMLKYARALAARLLTLLLVLALAAPAHAQTFNQPLAPLPSYILGFSPVGVGSITATTSSSRIVLPVGGNVGYVCNTGQVAAFFLLGSSSVSVVANKGFVVQPNQCANPVIVGVNGATPPVDLAAITASGTTTLTVYIGVVTQPQPGNYDSNVILTLTAAGTSTVNSADQINFNGAGANCFLNVTATGGSPTYTLTIQGKDTGSGTYYNLVASAPAATSGNILVSTFPGQTTAATAAQATAAFPLPRTYRLSVTVAGTTPSVTATAGCSVIY